MALGGLSDVDALIIRGLLEPKAPVLPSGAGTGHHSADPASRDAVGSAEPQIYELEIPLVDGREPLNANDRWHWREERRRKQLVRDSVRWRVKEAGIPSCQHITVAVHYLPGDKRIRDASNLMATQKPALDAVVRAGVVADDSAQWVTERMPVIEEGDGPRRLWLRVEVNR